VARVPGASFLSLWPTAEVIWAGLPPLHLGVDRLAFIETRKSPGPGRPPEEVWVEIPWDDLTRVSRDGKQVILSGASRRVLSTPSIECARLQRARIEQVLQAKPKERAKVLQQIAQEQRDEKEFERLRSQSGVRRELRMVAALQAVLYFILLPAVLYAPAQNARAFLSVLLIAMAVLHLALTIFSVRRLRGAGRSWSETLSAVVTIALLPPSAMHALGALLRDRYLHFAPALLAKRWLDREALYDLAQRELARIERRRLSTDHPLGRKYWEDAAAEWQWALSQTSDPAEAFAIYRPKDPTAASYCPLCRAEYRSGFDVCQECAEPLVKWARD
jgi:hypothetical protein